jgi:RNA polymerase sigma-70 factor (ECF subfamily)
VTLGTTAKGQFGGHNLHARIACHISGTGGAYQSVRTESKALTDPEPVSGQSSAGEFESFFRAHYPGVVRIAQSVVGDSHTAQDVAQEVFIAAQQRFADPGSSAHAAAWVRVAAVHAGLNAVRGRRRRHSRHLRAGDAVGPVGPEELVLERMSRQDVRDALGRLPRRAATVLVLRHSGFSYGEVAEAMGVGIGQVGTMLRRAEAALRKEIERATRS